MSALDLSFIKNRLEELGKSQVDLARYLKIEPPHLNKTLDGSRKVQMKELAPMAKFLEYDVESFARFLSGENIEIKKSADTDNNIRIPYMNIAASAGRGLCVGNEYIKSFICVSRGKFEEYLKNIHNPAVITVDGDSMAPTLKNNTPVMVETDIDPSNFEEGKIYVININDELYIKRLFRNPVTKELICKSDNPLYPEFTVKQQDISIKAKLVVQIFTEIN